MGNQMVFQRYEIKYLMSKWQRDRILKAMEPYLSIDRFGHSEIRNLYYDTPDYRLIRASLERPVYKEKLRLRSYGKADAGKTTFMELKKKYRSVVYKRRIPIAYGEALDALAQTHPMPDSQIGREIAYVLSFYHSLEPRVFLSYEREAFFDRDGSDFRVTFDEAIRYRWDDLTLAGNCGGIPILPKDQVLMELKTSSSLPLWMVRTLSELEIQRTSFSKYGRAYLDLLKSQNKGDIHYA